MTGKRGRSGNRTGPRGRRLVVEPRLDHETAMTIKVLVMARGQTYSAETVSALIGEWTQTAWQQYDAAVLHDAEREVGMSSTGAAGGRV